MMKNKEENKPRKKAGWKILSFLSHLAIIILIALSFFPLAKLYFDHLPPMGGDFYQTSTYFSYYHRFMAWPHLAWKYIWYNGVPALFDYPWLHMYLGSPLLNFFTSFVANKIYGLATLFAYFFFSYLLFYRLSRNKIFSAFLSSVLVWSISTYVALFFAGSGAFSANLMLTPLVFYLLYKYFEARRKKWLILAGLISGLSVMGHQGMSILFIVLPAFLILFFDWSGNQSFFSGRKFKDIIIYGFIFLFSGILGLYPYLVSFLGSVFGFETNMSMQTSAWPRKEAIRDLFVYNNYSLYLALGLVFIWVILQKRLRKSLKESLPFISLVAYIFIFEVLMYLGKNPFSETLGADRAFWFFPLVLGGAAAVFFRLIKAQRPADKKISPGFIYKGLVIAALAVSFISAPHIHSFMKERSGLARIMIPAQNLMIEPSKENKKEVVPAWLDTEEKNYRLHTYAGITTWWNALYDLPVTTGYADPQGVKARSWAYWRDTSITSEAVEKFEVPEDIAQENAFFLADWYAIRYLEYSSQGYPPPDYLFGNSDFIKQKELMEKTGFYFYEARKDQVSPIIRPTNAPTLLVVSSLEAYNSILRVLAQENLNSKYLIPLHYSHYLDDLNKLDLSQFDALFLYDYKYRREKNFKNYPQKLWERIDDFVQKGGCLFLETGAEVKESDVRNLSSLSLPEVFPVSRTTRGELGKTWALTPADPDILREVEYEKFDPLIYQDSAWKVSYAENNELKSWSEPVLSQKNKLILVKGERGEGRVIWSGINLPYHTKSFNNIAEGKLFKNLIDYLVGLKEEKKIDFELERQKSEKISLKAADFKGILFKESNYGGWVAESGAKNVKAFEAGPGMMYFPLSSSEEVEVEVYYRGLIIYWVMFILTALTLVFVFLFFLLEDKLTHFFRSIFRIEKIKKLTKGWWDKDEDEE